MAKLPISNDSPSSSLLSLPAFRSFIWPTHVRLRFFVSRDSEDSFSVFIRLEMARGERHGQRRFGSMKAANGRQREAVLEGNSTLKKPQRSLSERLSPRRTEIHRLRRAISQSRESGLVDARKMVRDLASRMEESNSKEKAHKLEGGEEEWESAVEDTENHHYAEVMRELEFVKQELSKLKLEMASVLEERSTAENVTEASSSKILPYLSPAAVWRKEIEEFNEQQLQVEAIDAHGKEEKGEFSFAVENARKKMNDILQESDRAKKIEMELAVITYDVKMLEDGLNMAKETKKRESESPLELQSVIEELEAAKKELESTKEEGFQFTASMDVIRNELKHVSEELARLQKTEGNIDASVQLLNSKLPRANSKLESVSAAEEKATTIVSNLSLSLEQLKTEAEAAKKEKELISEQTLSMKAEIQRTESQIGLAEERLQAAMRELEAVKSSESTALENLRSLIEKTNGARASGSACHHSSTTTISKFEYEYLTGRAVGTEDIADKKVAAAQAWIEALKANVKEILMKTELAHRKIRERKVEEEEEEETYKTEKPLPQKRAVETERQIWREKTDGRQPGTQKLQLQVKGNRNSTASARRGRSRKTASPATQHTPGLGNPSSTKRKEKALPILASSYYNKSVNKDH
ncbi:protein PLASTID MOVEMENT IMPAIRED 15-like [Diospyros lotus]|uniref:protein PLASTID MOVEMENT IMPAIRED 15-like n=1 Tax=Diospyros lotus TaxID=55363 RepID=UPI00225AE4D3|nr:protein PLASTID MOVEMENT IMPAIRED 15-like [Diospyros lotus]